MKHTEKEKIMSELHALEKQADAANDRMNNFQEDLAGALTDIAFKHFCELKDMDAEEIRAFGEIVSTHTWRLTADLDRLHYEVRHKT